MRKLARAHSRENPRSLSFLPPVPAEASAGQRWKYQRNMVIYFLHKQGLTQRFIGDVFDLPHSRIGMIIREMRAFEASQRGQADEDDDD